MVSHDSSQQGVSGAGLGPGHIGPPARRDGAGTALCLWHVTPKTTTTTTPQSFTELVFVFI